MRVRNWALAAAAVLLLVVAIVPAQLRSKGRGGVSRGTPAAASGHADVGPARRRVQAPAADGGSPEVADAVDASVKTPIPDLRKVSGSCLQEDTKEGQLCTDFFAGPEEMDKARLQCRRTRRYPNAAWSDAPCDHLTSHGGCWSAKLMPARIRWFYGKLHADFRPGIDTHRVCGSFALGFKPDGTPVKADGVTVEPGAARADDADPENP